mgnify:CR=1 FL=1
MKRLRAQDKKEDRRGEGGFFFKFLTLFWRRLAQRLQKLYDIFSGFFLFSLTRRIVLLNLAALAALVFGIIHISAFKENLVQAKTDSLRIQGKIIAGAIAASAMAEKNAPLIAPKKLLELQAAHPKGSWVPATENWDFPLNPERVALLLARVLSPSGTRARVYDAQGNLLVDSQTLILGEGVQNYSSLPHGGSTPNFGQGLYDKLRDWFFSITKLHRSSGGRQVSGEENCDSQALKAFKGEIVAYQKYDPQGHLVANVALPVASYPTVMGVLLLSSHSGFIDSLVEQQYIAMLKVFLVVSLVLLMLSLLLAHTIAQPLHKLAKAADYIRYGLNRRCDIPDYSGRVDEIGHLSASIRAMTEAFYSRIEAIESFAADVSHELKNPLTSLSSAVETLPLAKTEETKQRLMDIMQHDVTRLDRLITDIASASRLEAELVREEFTQLDLQSFLSHFVEHMRNAWYGQNTIRLELEIVPCQLKNPYLIRGHPIRLERVFSNLVDNACSFVSAQKGVISVQLERQEKHIIVTLEDNGTGIATEKIERIFERFYTDRPEASAFGQNSGLGLSISRQIIEAHGGTLTAENIITPKKAVAGARFIIKFPPLY